MELFELLFSRFKLSLDADILAVGDMTLAQVLEQKDELKLKFDTGPAPEVVHTKLPTAVKVIYKNASSEVWRSNISSMARWNPPRLSDRAYFLPNAVVVELEQAMSDIISYETLTTYDINSKEFQDVIDKKLLPNKLASMLIAKRGEMNRLLPVNQHVFGPNTFVGLLRDGKIPLQVCQVPESRDWLRKSVHYFFKLSDLSEIVIYKEINHQQVTSVVNLLRNYKPHGFRDSYCLVKLFNIYRAEAAQGLVFSFLCVDASYAEPFVVHCHFNQTVFDLSNVTLDGVDRGHFPHQIYSSPTFTLGKLLNYNNLKLLGVKIEESKFEVEIKSNVNYLIKGGLPKFMLDNCMTSRGVASLDGYRYRNLPETLPVSDTSSTVQIEVLRNLDRIILETLAEFMQGKIPNLAAKVIPDGSIAFVNKTVETRFLDVTELLVNILHALVGTSMTKVVRKDTLVKDLKRAYETGLNRKLVLPSNALEVA